MALVAYGLFFALGVAVAHAPPGGFDLGARAFVGHGALTAWILTESLYPAFLAPLCAAMLVIAALRPQWRARIVVSVVLLVVMWAATDWLQHLFMRPRPLAWTVRHEFAFGYPSSHAALATAFYGFWSYVFARSELPRALRLAASEGAVALVIAILWARLALGAHYPTDLAGGVLLGLCGVALALAVCMVARIRLYPGFFGDYAGRP